MTEIAAIRHGANRSRRLLRRQAGAVGVAGLVGVFGASLPPTAQAAPGHTLHLAFTQIDQSPDPAIWYGGLGNPVELGLYEGLTKYGQKNGKLLPDLATSWKVSPDGLTYTFRLRPGVTFHDGTPFNSTAAKYSWQRDIKIANAPEYMLTDVKSMATPNPQTFVVHLKTRNSAFLDYQASPYAPKFVSPTTVNAHLGNDDGQTWLATHDAGTGPYVLKSLSPTAGYVMQAYPGYWGHKPYYTSVNIAIVPNETTEELELQRGQLDMVTDGLSAQDLAKLSRESNLKEWEFPAIDEMYVAMNPTRNNIFSDPTIRRAVDQAINKKLIIAQTYGPAAKVSNAFYPFGELPEGLGEDKQSYDPSVLQKALSKTHLSKHIVIAELSGGGVTSQVSELIQAELQAAGVDATIRTYTGVVYNALPQHPKDQPDLVVGATNPDDASPAAWAQTYFLHKAPLNTVSMDVPAADAAVNAGLRSTSPAQATTDYVKAAKEYMAAGEVFPIADVNSSVVARASIKHIVHDVADPYGIVLADTHP
ncbi:MAG: hypothetical protein J2P58_00140 [Acidimicrobiaceae bacterium]|nr:hypothetical protein [Acidimicrobiaceae bacterium]